MLIKKTLYPNDVENKLLPEVNWTLNTWTGLDDKQQQDQIGVKSYLGNCGFLLSFFFSFYLFFLRILATMIRNWRSSNILFFPEWEDHRKCIHINHSFKGPGNRSSFQNWLQKQLNLCKSYCFRFHKEND